MTRRELLQRYRLALDDVEEPYLWLDEELTIYLNDAIDIACEEARILEDVSTASVVEVSITADDSTASIDSSIVKINRAKFAGQSTPMKIIYSGCIDYLDANYSGWESSDSSTSSTLLTEGFGSNTVGLYPPHDTTETLYLRVYRRPLAAERLGNSDQDDESPVVDAKYHRFFDHYIMYRAYLKEDSQTHDPKKAAEHFARWKTEGLGGIQRVDIIKEAGGRVIGPLYGNL
jgi:hypothetical protein